MQQLNLDWTQKTQNWNSTWSYCSDFNHNNQFLRMCCMHTVRPELTLHCNRAGLTVLSTTASSSHLRFGEPSSQLITCSPFLCLRSIYQGRGVRKAVWYYVPLGGFGSMV